MAGSTTNISIRMDSDLKAQADALFGELGMNLSTAFNVFVRQSLREGRIPFHISHAFRSAKSSSRSLYPFTDGSFAIRSASNMALIVSLLG